jgi:hypothetical protein
MITGTCFARAAATDVAIAALSTGLTSSALTPWLSSVWMSVACFAALPFADTGPTRLSPSCAAYCFSYCT